MALKTPPSPVVILPHAEAWQNVQRASQPDPRSTATLDEAGLFGAARYIPGTAVLALLVWGTTPLRRLVGFNIDPTSLIILTMIDTAWYLGRGPGLVVAFAFEGMLE